MLDLNKISKHVEVAYDGKYKPVDFRRRKLPLTEDQKAARNIAVGLGVAVAFVAWYFVIAAVVAQWAGPLRSRER